MNHLITFGDDNFKYKKILLERDAKLTGWFDNIIIHSPETISDFLEEHKDFVQRSNKGYGYWIWKPHIILTALEKMEDGDFLFYVDSGATILKHQSKRFYEYIDILNGSDKPIIVFNETYGNLKHLERYTQKMGVLKRFGLENDETFLNSSQVEAGIFICKKCDFSVNFVKEWFNLLVEDDYSLVVDDDVFPQSESFISHRHDQSLLSILCKIHNVNILYLGECYGTGPFFSTRTSDYGPRELAPDLCRGEDDFDIQKHFGWKTYLGDDEVKERTINEIQKLFSDVGEKLTFDDIDFNLKKEFINHTMSKLDNIQKGKGIYQVEISIFETVGIAPNKEKINGRFSCEFNIGDKYFFDFEITSNNITFFEKSKEYNRVFKNTYTRTWIP